MQTKFTETFGVRFPIVQGGMGGVAGPDLVAAVANAGGLGILPIWLVSPENARELIKRTQALTNKPFAVNLRSDLEQVRLIETAAEAGITLFNLFWGDPSSSMPAIEACGGRLIATVGDLGAAKQAIEAGASALIAQGVEAGGHVLGEALRDQLVTELAAENFDVTIIAAGGLATADHVAHVISLGADAALLGTRFVVARESIAHPVYKNAIIAAEAGSTVRTSCFDGMWPNAPHRVLKNSTYEVWDAAGCQSEGLRPGEGNSILIYPDGSSFPRYSAMTPRVGMQGEIEASALYAGMGVGEIVEQQTAAEIIAELTSKL
ncbi:NAD(P)H-dependent flavin oxidoreductase [Hyphomonas sp.]|jgi:nitronate monooxygenase|uniref:NAD(P)H-dependent flavin oxidoreductase n=1 Tax=Hyphomonas sp. TaxID=87 RepID=UPI0039E535BC